MVKLGATRDFLRGKLHKTDEGGIRLAVGVKGDCVIVDFGTQVVWLGMPKANALAFAESIRKAAESLPDDHPTHQ